MISSFNGWLSRASYALLVLAIASTGVLTGRAFAIGQAERPPAIGELRSAPDFFAIPARRYQPPDELARSVDAIGIVRVNAIDKVKLG